jgi:hypothetical protein
VECMICFTCRKRITADEIAAGLHNHPQPSPAVAEEPLPAWKNYLLKAAQPFAGIRPRDRQDI